MRILRLHRGFTTNSSSASEYLDPSKPPPVIATDLFDAYGNLRDDVPLHAPSASASSSGRVNHASSAKDPGMLADNAVMLLVLLGTVLGLFAVERGVRKAWRSRREEEV